MKMKKTFCAIWLLLIFCNCHKQTQNPTNFISGSFQLSSVSVDKISNTSLLFYNVSSSPSIVISFDNKLKTATTASAITFKNANNQQSVAFNSSFVNNDSAIAITPQTALSSITNYKIVVAA